MKIYITADWHLAEGAWKKRPEIKGDAFESLRRLITNAGEHYAILAAGDLLDVKLPTAETILQTRNLLRSAPLMLFIQGQHEYSSHPWFKLFGYHGDTVSYGTSASCKRLGNDINIHGIDWTLSANLQEKLDEVGERLVVRESESKPYNILMLHQTCNAVMAGTGKDRADIIRRLDYRACELKDGMLPHGFDLVVVGDTHYHTEFQLVDKEGAVVRCLSPGSFAMQTITELNTGQCFVLDSQTREISSMELYRRPYNEVTINNPIEFDEEIRRYIKADIVDEFNQPIVKYTLYENDADRAASLQQACKGKAHPFFYTVSETAENSLSDIEPQTESLNELVLKAVNEAEATDDAKRLLVDLIRHNSADEIIYSYYQKMVLT